MRSFLQRYRAEIKGVLSGFDRVRFRGTIRWLASLPGMTTFMKTTGLLLKHFNVWAKDRTEQIREATEHLAEAANRPVVYLASSQVSKEETALKIAARDGITEGLVAVLSCVEPCHSFRVGPNRERRLLELRLGPMKCLHYYFYVLDPQLGLTYLRLQTWAPFTIHIGLNGREWLARQLAAEGIAFEQRDNCFVDLADPQRASVDGQATAHQLDPLVERLVGSVSSGARDVVRRGASQLLLVGGRNRMGDRRNVPLARGFGSALPALGAPRDHDLQQQRCFEVLGAIAQGSLLQNGRNHDRTQGPSRRNLRQALSQPQLAQDVRQTRLESAGRNDIQQPARIESAAAEGQRPEETQVLATPPQRCRRSAPSGETLATIERAATWKPWPLLTNRLLWRKWFVRFAEERAGRVEPSEGCNRSRPTTPDCWRRSAVASS